MNAAFDELFENAFKTGDYSKLKEMIEKYERESVFLYPTEKKAIEIFNYFINYFNFFKVYFLKKACFLNIFIADYFHYFVLDFKLFLMSSIVQSCFAINTDK